MNDKYKDIKKRLKMYGEVKGLKTGKPVNVHDFNSKKSKLSIDYWKTRKSIKKKYDRVLINMELENGNHRFFVVSIVEGGFTFRKGHYLLDDESKYYNVENDIYCYDFHERISIPIKRIFPATELIGTVEDTDDIEYSYAINPLTLKRFSISKIAEGIMRGQAIDSALKFLTWVCVIGTTAVVIHLILYIIKSGMLSNAGVQ